VRLRLYVRPEIVVWLGLTVMGTAVSILSAREMAAGIESIKRVALRRPHAKDVLSMARHNLLAEHGRTVAQSLFLLTGLLSLVSKPRARLGRPQLVDRVLPWIVVAVEGILVANSANEYVLSRRVLKRRAEIQAASKGPGKAT
jgi:hypothetical protein